MPLDMPTTQEIYEQNVATYEAWLNQTTPMGDKAFTRVLAAVEAGNYTLLRKLGVHAVQGALAISAGEEDLERIGNNYGVIRTPPVAWQGKIEVENTSAIEDITLNSGREWVSEDGYRYTLDTTTEISASTTEELEITAKHGGVDYNLSPTAQLTIAIPRVGINPIADVSETTTDGINEEDLEDYRRRVLNEIRTVGGGSDGVDYRTWAEQTPGIIKAFPYSDVPERDIEDHDSFGSLIYYFKDADCEWPTTAYWQAGNGATLVKDTSPVYAGSRSLKIIENGTANPYAYQPMSGADTCLRVGVMYNFTGYARGTVDPAVPQILCGGVVLWEHGGGAAWEEFDITFVATDTEIWLGSDAAMGSGDVVYFDAMDMTLVAQPGDRVVYCEADHDIVGKEGEPTQALLDDAREYINTDPDTGKTRPSLGHTNDSLWVEPITRTDIYVEVRGLDVDADILDQVKDDIEEAVENYLQDVVPYVDGVDPVITRNDKITDLTVSQVIQDVLTPVGGSAEGIGIGTEPSVFISSYQLSQGEMAQLVATGITWV